MQLRHPVHYLHEAHLARAYDAVSDCRAKTPMCKTNPSDPHCSVCCTVSHESPKGFDASCAEKKTLGCPCKEPAQPFTAIPTPFNLLGYGDSHDAGTPFGLGAVHPQDYVTQAEKNKANAGDPDADCNSWSFLKPVCVFGKSITKGGKMLAGPCGPIPIPCGVMAIAGVGLVLMMMFMLKR